MEELNYYIKGIADRLFISHSGTERDRIKLSITSLQTKLKRHFGNKIIAIVKFGSYTRGTILPRKYDLKSDIDIMIEFNTKDYPEMNPETYRRNLRKFADLYYPRSIVSLSLPSIVLELQNIKFDLVPAVKESSFFFIKTYIPDSGNEWQETDPNGFNDDLVQANKRYNNIVKPIIRLMKYWNASNNYPYESFVLEQIIADMNFSNDSYESGFFYAISNLPTYGGTVFFKNKVNTLQHNKDWVIEYLNRGEIEKAKMRLHKILPRV